jgi:serine/threonine protein kinase
MALDLTKGENVRNLISSQMIPEEDKLGPSSFKIIQVLGKGSFGKVYLAEKNGALFAMKVLDKDRIFEKNLLRYVISERNVLSFVDHPFIVKLHHSF